MSDSIGTPILDPIAVRAASYAPTPQAAMQVSQWFATETMEVEVGDTVGRPAQEVKLSRDVVTYLLANGWYITEYLASAEGGEWTSSATATVTTASGSTSASNASSKANFESSSTGSQLGEGETEGSTTGSSDGESSSSGSTSNSGASTTVSENGGAPFWFSCFKVRLQRRRIQAENVLQDMVQSFTDAYNEGRQVNSDRYDEIVSLYALMLARTESEANNIPIADIDVDDFKDLNERVREAVRERLDAAGSIVDGLTGEGLAKVREQISLVIDDFKAMYDAMKTAVGNAQKLTMDDFKSMYDAAKAAVDGAQTMTMDDFKAMYDAMKTAIGDARRLTVDDFKAMYDAAKAAVDGAQSLTMDDFKAMYDAAKDSINGVKVITAADIKALVDAALASIRAALAKFAESVDGLPEGWLESRTEEINRKFNALVSEAQAKMVSAGTYNATVWPTTESGIERDRQIALNDLIDEIARIKVDVYGKIATITADAETRALEAPLKLADIERALAELETAILDAGMKLADVQRGLADVQTRMLDSGLKLADVQQGFAEVELKVNDSGMRLADVQRGLADAQARMLDSGLKLADVQQGFAEVELKMNDSGMKLSGIQDDLAKLELNIADEKLKFADENVRIANVEAQLADLDQKLLETEVRISDLINKQMLGVTELRNTVLKWMLDFMERRDDEHPSLDSLVNIADKLGYAEGAPAANIS